MNKLNIKSTVIGVVSIGLLVVMAYAGGCRMDEVIRVDVPPGVQAVTGVPDKVTLRDAEYVREDYMNQVTRDIAIFDENISDGLFWSGVVASAINTGFEMAVPALGSVPAGGIILLSLGTIMGKFLKRPGEKADNDSTWDEAFNAGKQAILEGTNATAPPVK